MTRGLRGAGLGTSRQPGRPGVGGRAARRPPGGDAGRRHLPHAGPRRRRHRAGRRPRRPDRLPAGGGRAAAGHERARVEPALPLLPRPGHPRRRRRRRRRPSRRATADRSRWRCSATSCARRTRPSPPATRCARWSSSRTSSPASAQPTRRRSAVTAPPPARPAPTWPSSSSPTPTARPEPAAAPGVPGLRALPGEHRTKPVTMVAQRRRARRPQRHPRTPAGGTPSASWSPPGSTTVAARAKALLWPAVDRTRGAGEARLPGITSPSGVHVFVSDDRRRRTTTGSGDFEPVPPDEPRARLARHRPRRGRRTAGAAQRGGGVPPHRLRPRSRARPRSSWSRRAGCAAAPCARRTAGPALGRSTSRTSAAAAPPRASPRSRSRCDDLLGPGAAAPGRGVPLMPVPDNYYVDLGGALRPARTRPLAELREHQRALRPGR